MRGSVAIVLLLISCPLGLGDEADPKADDAEAIRWEDPFASISATEAENTIVVLMITNDDPFPKKDSGRKPRGGARMAPTHAIWCKPVFSQAVRVALKSRPDLGNRLRFQAIPAGMPAVLTGGEVRRHAARAAVCVCDGNYRLLSFCFGVPDTADFLTLLEDADDVQAMRRLHSDTRDDLIASVAQRSNDRLSRLWRGALKEMLLAMGPQKFNDSDTPGAASQRQIGRLSVLSDTYHPHYLADVKLRFGLSEAADRTRLLVLEQHCEARRPWCEAMIPFLAGDDFLTLWKPLVESAWGFQPITEDADAEELLRWWDSQVDANPVVLALQPSALAGRNPWPPAGPDAKGSNRGLGWKDVQDLATKLPYRAIDAQRLALLIRQRDLSAVDLNQPSPIRYLLFEPGKKSPTLVRQTDPPGRFVGQLKRAK